MSAHAPAMRRIDFRTVIVLPNDRSKREAALRRLRQEEQHHLSGVPEVDKRRLDDILPPGVRIVVSALARIIRREELPVGDLLNRFPDQEDKVYQVAARIDAICAGEPVSEL